MFAVDGGTTQGVAETMNTHGLTAKDVKGGGFDLLPRTLALVEAGLIIDLILRLKPRQPEAKEPSK